MTKENLKPEGYPSPETIEGWKQEHGRIFEMKSDGEPVLIIRKPRMRDIERAQTSDKKDKKPNTFNKSIIANCKLWEKPGALQDDSVLMGVYSELDKIVVIADVEVEEL